MIRHLPFPDEASADARIPRCQTVELHRRYK